MASPLVETKLFIPGVRGGAVPRARLNAHLRRGSAAKLTLISAPAGFGKTTALASWLAEPESGNRLVAWLSLEEHDSQPTTFWTYVTASLAKVVPGLVDDALSQLASPQPQVQTVLTTLVNELSGVRSEIYLVLDDYHQVEGPDIAAGMTFLLEHLPPNVHLVISTRADPTLPLPRLRARGQLVEIRAGDLRFTPKEVAQYLDNVAGLSLANADIATLEVRTEGWIAALQLAALSMQGRDDVSRFIAGFAGDDRYIVDYLVEEVLARQPDHVRSFLINTSVLDRLCGPLCDAVTGHPGGKAMLETLERSNLFVVPLDERRHWYRYHHLFADVLRTHLGDEQPGAVPSLHRRASQWYEEQDEAPASVRHALAAGDDNRAAILVEAAIPTLQRTRQDGTIRGWVDVIPDAVVRARPVLAVLFVGALMSAGEFDGVEQRLDDAEQCLDSLTRRTTRELSGPLRPMVVTDPAHLAGLPGTIAMYRAALALHRGDVPSTVKHAQQAMALAADGDELVRAGASALSGLASWSDGDLEAAHLSYSDCVERMQRIGHIADILGCSIPLADIRLTQGRLGDALATYERALALAAGQPAPQGGVLPGTADMHVGLSHVAYERGDLTTALGHLSRSQELGDRAGLPQNPYRWRVAMARLKDAQGDLPGALELLDEAQAVYTGDFLPDVRPVAAVRARVLTAHGYLDEPLTWAREHGLTANDDLTYLHEYEHVTLACILLARHTSDSDKASLREATDLLQRLLDAAESGGRTGTAIEVLILQALARQADADTAGGLVDLGRALGLAEPEGYVRVFVGEGPDMAVLLEATLTQHGGSAYVQRLLDACRQTAPASGPAERRAHVDRHVPHLVEQLSERELEVLRLLSTDLDGPAIARHLVVSLHTVRTHTHHIYAKLGANNRRAAVTRARELGLLPSSSRP